MVRDRDLDKDWRKTLARVASRMKMSLQEVQEIVEEWERKELPKKNRINLLPVHETGRLLSPVERLNLYW